MRSVHSSHTASSSVVRREPTADEIALKKSLRKLHHKLKASRERCEELSQTVAAMTQREEEVLTRVEDQEAARETLSERCQTLLETEATLRHDLQHKASLLAARTKEVGATARKLQKTEGNVLRLRQNITELTKRVGDAERNAVLAKTNMNEALLDRERMEKALNLANERCESQGQQLSERKTQMDQMYSTIETLQEQLAQRTQELRERIAVTTPSTARDDNDDGQDEAAATAAATAAAEAVKQAQKEAEQLQEAVRVADAARRRAELEVERLQQEQKAHAATASGLGEQDVEELRAEVASLKRRLAQRDAVITNLNKRLSNALVKPVSKTVLRPLMDTQPMFASPPPLPVTKKSLLSPVAPGAPVAKRRVRSTLDRFRRRGRKNDVRRHFRGSMPRIVG